MDCQTLEILNFGIYILCLLIGYKAAHFLHRDWDFEKEAYDAGYEEGWHDRSLT